VTELIQQTLQSLEAKIQWIKCPWCQEEWARLMPSCGLCIDCGRDVRGFRQAVVRMPAKTKVTVDIELSHFGQSVQRQFRMPSMFIAKLTTGYREAFATVEPQRNYPIIVAPTELEPKSFQDVFAAWDDLKLFFDHGRWKVPKPEEIPI
jgi:hypothetical protein